MKKFILIILSLFFIMPQGFAEEFPPTGQGIAITKETNPIYWKYLEDYGAKLKEALEAKRMFRLRGMGADYKFFLTRNGEIKDMKLAIYQNKYFNEKVKEIILSVDPLPFRDGMDIDEMQFSVYLGFEHYDEINIVIGRTLNNNKRIFSLTVITNK